MTKSESTIQIIDENKTADEVQATVQDLIAALGSGEMDDIRMEIDPYLCNYPLGGFTLKDYFKAAKKSAAKAAAAGTAPRFAESEKENHEARIMTKIFGCDFGEQVIAALEAPEAAENPNVGKFMLVYEVEMGRKPSLAACTEWQRQGRQN